MRVAAKRDQTMFLHVNQNISRALTGSLLLLCKA